eukprot:3344788-Pyramimonas_sp.AAC.1
MKEALLCSRLPVPAHLLSDIAQPRSPLQFSKPLGASGSGSRPTSKGSLAAVTFHRYPGSQQIAMMTCTRRCFDHLTDMKLRRSPGDVGRA